MERPPPRKGHSGLVNVVDEDPDLAERLSPEQRANARRDAIAGVLVLETGESVSPHRLAAEAGALGLLVVDGVIVRSICVGSRWGVELFGAGDLIGPSEAADDVLAMVPAKVRSWALTRTRLAMLDASFTRRICGYPEVINQLSARLERRSSTHALRLTIIQQPQLSVRLQLLLWHLADRFGRVQREGVVLPLSLSHELLAQLVGAQRPSVSRVLKQLERSSLVARQADGSWWLGGQPPFSARR